MKKLDRNVKLLLAIIVVLGLSLSVMAQPSPRAQMHRQYIMGHAGMPFLDLTEDQKAEIKAIHLAHMKAVQPLKDEVKINRTKVNALLKNDDPDMEEIVSLVEATGKLLTQIQIKGIEKKIQVRSLLTDEQKIIYDAHSEKTGKRRALVQHYRHRRVKEISRF